LKIVTPHPFRYSMATPMLRNHAILGHSQISSAEIYTHVSLEDLKALIRRAHPQGKKSQK